MNSFILSRNWKLLLAWLIVLVSIVQVIRFASNSRRNQWDLRVYYHASEAFLDGSDPYDSNQWSEVADNSMELEYVYPPITLLLFAPLTILPYSVAVWVFIFLKAACLALLITTWIRWFVPDKQFGPLFWLFIAFAFNRTVYIDFRVGNIAIFEQFLIWFALACFLRKRFILFTVIIVTASLFKVFPILFLGLLLIPESKRSRKLLFSGIAAFVVCNAGMYVAWTDLFRGFVNNASAISESGLTNPSSLALLKDWFSAFSVTGDVYMIAYVAVALIAIGFTATTMIRFRFSGNTTSLITLYCLAYALIMPQLRSYSYILLIVPLWYTLSRQGRGFRFWILYLLCILPLDKLKIEYYQSFGGIASVIASIPSYLPLLLIVFAFTYSIHSRVPQINQKR
jgi:hypothetical protein